MIMKLISQPGAEEWRIAELNPWMYSDLDSLAAALFMEIRQALPADRRWKETRKKIAAFGEAVSPLGALGALVGVNGQGVLKAAADRIGGDTSATAAKRKVEAALRELNQPILVVMDDLDRLTPAELLLVFKLVRLVGHLPNVHYLLSYDERTLRDVLSRSELFGGKEARAGDFLEKIIQVLRLDLPAFRERDAAALIDDCLAAVLKAYQREWSTTDISRFQGAFFDHLQDRLMTPRSIKRFFAQVDAGLRSVAAEVDMVDYMLVTFLRTMEPGVFSMIKQHRDDLVGATPLLPSSKPADRLKEWREWVAAAGVAEENLEGVLRLLAILFKPVSDALVDRRSLASADADQRRGVGSSDYFDRYVVFSVPEDDLPEAIFVAFNPELLERGATPPPQADR
jgi:predicted KAP-like P-loop ATPase